MAMTKRDAFNKAFELINTGLQSGSIKLSGSQTSEEVAKRHAKADVAYISALLDGLQEHVIKVAE